MDKNTSEIIHYIYKEYDEPWTIVKKSLKRLTILRIAITLFIVVWVLVMSYYLTRNYDEDDKEQGERRAKYFYLHRVWFGEESTVMIIFKMWIWAVILMLLAPLLRHVVLFLRIRDFLQN
jgi:heme/copper-type cytochrome/quinol oxidase subunit 2